MCAEAISVIIPAFNDVEGVLAHMAWFNRADRPVEVIVVDDASADGPGAALSDAPCAAHVTLKLLVNRENLGAGPSRNLGLDAAEHPWVLFLDADDRLAEGFFDFLTPALPRGDVAFTLFRHHLVTAPGAEHSYRMAPRDERLWAEARGTCLAGPVTLAEAPSLAGTVNYPWNRIYQTAFLRKNEIRFPDLRQHEDAPHHWAAFLAAPQFRVLDDAPPLIHHYQLGGGGRATDDRGARRLQAFDALEMILAAEPRLTAAPALFAVFVDFSLDLMAWAIRMSGTEALRDRALGRAGEVLIAMAARAPSGADIPNLSALAKAPHELLASA